VKTCSNTASAKSEVHLALLQEQRTHLLSSVKFRSRNMRLASEDLFKHSERKI